MNNQKYTLKRKYRDYPIETEIIVRERNNDHILIAIDGMLEYMPIMDFWIITGQIGFEI